MSKKILVIEDETSVKGFIRELLENNKYIVFTASDGKEGLQLARELKPDLIVCDIMMPQMNGYEVIKGLKEDPVFINLPFIFLTAKAEITDFREGMDLGADDYVTKPFRAASLLKTIENKLAKFSMAQNAQSDAAIKTIEEKELKLTENSKLFFTVKNKPQIIRVGDILYIKAEGEYSSICLVSGEKILKRKLVKEWEEQLPQDIFLRIHRSVIININRMEKIEKWYNRSYAIYLTGCTEKFIASQRYASKLRTNLSL